MLGRVLETGRFPIVRTADCLFALRGIQVSRMQPSLQCHDDSTWGAEKSLSAVQVEITSGDIENRFHELQTTAYFIGSDQECDMVLGDDRFPAIYAFLLVHPRGVVLRHLGGGPEICVDGQPTERILITGSAHVTAGSFAFTLRVLPNTTLPAAQLQMHESESQASDHAPIKLIEQASRLLSEIQQQVGHTHSPPHPYVTNSVPRENDVTPGTLTVTPLSLNISIGLPPVGNLPPAWKHLCL